MRDKSIRKVGVWILCAVVIGCLGYSTLVLSARPAYADTVCEPEDCTLVRQQIGPAVCQQYQGFRSAACPAGPSMPDTFIVFCNDGQQHLIGSCSTF
jgi:hypothetical protein